MSKIKQVVVNGRGQIVIPASLRLRFDMKPGTRVAFAENDGRLQMQPINYAFIHRYFRI